MNPLYVGIDIGSKSNVAYLMRPDGNKFSSFSVQNNRGGAILLSEKIVSALNTLQLTDVVIGLEATSIYGDNLMYALREVTSAMGTDTVCAPGKHISAASRNSSLILTADRDPLKESEANTNRIPSLLSAVR